MSIVSTSTDSVRATDSPPGSSWREEMRRAVRDPVELCRRLDLPEELGQEGREATAGFPLFVPHPFLGRMRQGDATDPLLRQVLPISDELNQSADFMLDPVGDDAATVRPGLIKKYQRRALLILTGACAVHCRYCFRRHFAYGDAPRSVDDWQPVLAAIEADRSIEEVILSGGDPLTLVDTSLADLIHSLAEVSHVRRLRVHTRLPIMIPQRVNDELLAWLCGTRLKPMVVVHANHAAEIDAAVAASFAKLIDAGMVVLNQAVLLRGVNDSVSALEQLSLRLVDLRVMPYYLHQLDRVAGAAHFEVPIPKGKRLIAELRDRLPGYAVPRYVQEIRGEASKHILA